jgi:hypothetical protein
MNPEILENTDPGKFEVVTRPCQGTQKTQAAQPIDPEQLSILNKARENPEYESMDELDTYQYLTSLGISKENALAEAEIKAKN